MADKSLTARASWKLIIRHCIPSQALRADWLCLPYVVTIETQVIVTLLLPEGPGDNKGKFGPDNHLLCQHLPTRIAPLHPFSVCF